MSTAPREISKSRHSMQSCISYIKALVTVSVLNLNDNKTKVMLVASKRTKYLHSLLISISIVNAQISFKQSVKNVDFTLDCYPTMNDHVSTIAPTYYFKLHRLACIRKLTIDTIPTTLTIVTHYCLVIFTTYHPIHTPATLAPAHTSCLCSIDLHTVRQHFVIAHFLLLLIPIGIIPGNILIIYLAMFYLFHYLLLFHELLLVWYLVSH